MYWWLRRPREVTLQPAQRNTRLLHREIVACATGPYAGGKVDPTAHGWFMLHDRLALDTAAGADSTLDVCDATCLTVPAEVVIWLDLVQITHAVDVGWVKDEFVRFAE